MSGARRVDGPQVRTDRIWGSAAPVGSYTPCARSRPARGGGGGIRQDPGWKPGSRPATEPWAWAHCQADHRRACAGWGCPVCDARFPQRPTYGRCSTRICCQFRTVEEWLKPRPPLLAARPSGVTCLTRRSVADDIIWDTKADIARLLARVTRWPGTLRPVPAVRRG